MCIRDRSYSCPSYLSSRACIHTNDIGENCFILEGVTVQPFTKIGSNVTIWTNSQIGHHSVIEDHVFISSMVGVSGRCHVANQCFSAGKSGIDSHVNLAEGTMLGFRATAIKDTDPWSIYTGSPGIKRKPSSESYPKL